MKRMLLLLLVMICSVMASWAQNALQLSEAVSIALNNSLDIQVSNNRIEAATIFNNYGYAGGLPLVTGSFANNEQITTVNQKLNTGNDIDRKNAAANNLSTNITGSMLLYNGGRVVATKKRFAQSGIQGKEQLIAQVQNIMASVMLAYYDIVRQQDYIKTIDRSIEASTQQLDIVKVRQQAGLANNADLFQAQIDLNVLQQSKLAQLLIVSQAKSELLRLLSLNADSVILVRDTILIERNIVLDTILNSLNKNADIKAAESQVTINELIVKETAAQRYPSIRATAGYAFSRNQAAAGNLLLNQNYGPTVGILIAVPIFNGSIFKRQQRVAKIDVQNAGLQKQILLRDFTALAVKQFQAYTNTMSQLDTAKQNYTLSNKLLELTLLRFKLKQATAVEVKNAQQSFEESGFRLVNLNFAAKSAEIELLRLANKLTL